MCFSCLHRNMPCHSTRRQAPDNGRSAPQHCSGNHPSRRESSSCRNNPVCVSEESGLLLVLQVSDAPICPPQLCRGGAVIARAVRTGPAHAAALALDTVHRTLSQISPARRVSTVSANVSRFGSCPFRQRVMACMQSLCTVGRESDLQNCIFSASPLLIVATGALPSLILSCEGTLRIILHPPSEQRTLLQHAIVQDVSNEHPPSRTPCCLACICTVCCVPKFLQRAEASKWLRTVIFCYASCPHSCAAQRHLSKTGNSTSERTNWSTAKFHLYHLLQVL